MNEDRQVIITFTLPKSMIEAIEQKVEGKTTEEKIVRAIEIGFNKITAKKV